MNRIYSFLGSAAVAAAVVLSPLAASAAHVSGSAQAGTGFFISPSGIVRVIGADVTAVSNGVVDAAAHFGSMVFNFVVNTSADTKIRAGASGNASSSAIVVGDKVSFVGSLSSSTASGFTVVATKIRDLTNFPPRHVASSTKEHGDNDGDEDTASASTSVNANASVNAGGHKDGEHGLLGKLHLFGGLHLGGDN